MYLFIQSKYPLTVSSKSVLKPVLEDNQSIYIVDNRRGGDNRPLVAEFTSRSNQFFSSSYVNLRNSKILLITSSKNNIGTLT